ncbi:hypothetical protein ASPWEDRAFT_134451 [Aspergillus wentii DTO 134E9]|uniref:Peptidase metallopeptidase domain-containing protein n=1 Tax=Aspergillus wentii DTO 134E9 TaxID=1073089 RepID=A0A1L9RLX8_ASPWE|nr:uncharacterized protein ASPWEDRAFT_134451 [Aspergillus wentii DTO 134E9]OJJ35931.1 hypothetical protein ASPWEDRAFT_134451 [Aspergillus wentii DTO 134E9]
MADDAEPTYDICISGAEDEPKSQDDLNAMMALSFQMNPRNEAVGFAMADGVDEKQPRLAMRLGKFWPAGKEIKIAFHSGTDWQKSFVEKYASEWTQYANLKFKWVGNYNRATGADILIDFKVGDGSWSMVGVDSLLRTRKGNPSMNFGWVDEGGNHVYMSGTVLHEFGHALGAHHEHSSPQSEIQWDKEAVYAAYGGPPNNWDKGKIDHNVMRVWGMDQVQSTRFDPDSIMLYSFPARYTLNNKGTKSNRVLSESDKQYMRFCYPGHATDAGHFNTMEIAMPSGKPRQDYKTEKYYHEKYASPPPLILGLNHLDMSGQHNARVQLAALDQGKEKFSARIRTWGDSVLNSAGMTWLEAGPKFDFLQQGTVELKDMSRWPINKGSSWKWIWFPRRFKTTPKVVPFIQSFDLDQKTGWRFKVYASRIRTNGCYIYVQSWDNTKIADAKVSWLAYPADQPGITSGRFSTNDVRSYKHPQADNSGTVKFDKPFAKLPKLLVALDEIDYSPQKDLRVRVGNSMVTERSFDWNLQSWGDSIMNCAGASYLAWGEPADSKSEGLVILE